MEHVMPPAGVGDTAPDFTLRRTFEEAVRLADLLARGPVLLHFYVFDFGGV
jgi:peroxiredoxin